MLISGHSYVQISRVLGRSKQSCEGAAFRLGLTRPRQKTVNDECPIDRSKPILKKRCCLSCQSDFLSEGFHNRICGACRKNRRR